MTCDYVSAAQLRVFIYIFSQNTHCDLLVGQIGILFGDLLPVALASGLQLFPRFVRETVVKRVDQSRFPEIPCVQTGAAALVELGVELIKIIPFDKAQSDYAISQGNLGNLFIIRLHAALKKR